MATSKAAMMVLFTGVPDADRCGRCRATEANILPSGLKATAVIMRRAADGFSFILPVSTSKTRIFLSPPPLTAICRRG